MDLSTISRRYEPYICILALIILFGIKPFALYVQLILGGVLLCLLLALIHGFTYNVTEPPADPPTTHFNFLEFEQWNNEIDALKIDLIKLSEPIVETFLISETLRDFISLIIQEFIDSWYKKISDDGQFQQSVQLELQLVFRKLKQRVSQLDLGKLLVSKLVPVINDHIVDYVRAEERVQSKISTANRSGDTIDHEIDVARLYRRGKIHQAVTISKSQSSTEVNEKVYLRTKVGQILPYLLSEGERENEIGISLVKEILACTVLTNIFKFIGEADFFNLMIVKLIGDNLKRKDQVKKLRAALDQHTHKQKDIQDDITIKKEYIITENMDMVSYNNCLENISKISSLDELKQLRVYVSLQLLQMPKSDSTLSKRLKEVQNVIESTIKKIENNSQLKLVKVLHNELYLEQFSNFVKSNGSQISLEFWLAVEKIKAPLELIDDKLSLSLGFTNSDEIKDIYTKYIQKLSLNPQDLKVIESYITSNDLIQKSELYQLARDKLFALQKQVYTSLEFLFEEFTKTDAYKELIQKPTHVRDEDNLVSPVVVKAVEDAFTQIMRNNNDLDSLSSKRQVSTLDLKKDLFGDTKSLFGGSGSLGSNRNSRLFDDSDESGTDSDSINFEADHLQSSTDLQSSIELQNSDLQNSLELESQPDDEKDEQSLLLAAPGNLKLTEEIGKLNEEVDILNEQLSILEPLIKKAELTNNITEIKILKNSKLSLEREINSKELQKQQYIVQENDNSLYGKSRVSIQSYISGKEKGQDFILYIIEVQRFSNTDPMNNTAGWIIARRFSQFYRLHEYLRAIYPEVSGLPFPKKSVFKLQKQTVEHRQKALETYLRNLLDIPQVCSNKIFRSFLSSENFSIRKNQLEESGAELAASTFYRVSSRLGRRNGNNEMAANNINPGPNVQEMEKELRSFDDKEVFIKPLINLLMTIFKLKNAKSWLRGRALLVILQQLFGTTIERKIYEVIGKVKQEEQILDVLIGVKNIVFPNNKFRESPPIRTQLEKTTTKEEAKFLLNLFMSETFSTIFGVSNSKYAFTIVFNMLQNDFLVRHMIFEIFDEIIADLFPELI